MDEQQIKHELGMYDGCLTVQQLCDELTMLCHNGHAQADIKIISDNYVKDVKSICLVQDNLIVLRVK